MSKALEFTVPDTNDFSIVIQEDVLPFFYKHFHKHKEYQITLILKGEGTAVIGNYMQPLKVGDIYFISPNVPHVFLSKEEDYQNLLPNRIHAIHIFFDLERLSNLLSLPEMIEIRSFLKQDSAGLQLLKGNKSYVSGCIIEAKNNAGLLRLMSLINILQYASVNSNDFKSLATGLVEHATDNKDHFRMNEVYQYTLKHYAEPITLEKIAEVACITPHAFCKYFKKHTRKTYLAFLNEIRVNEACKRILSARYNSISEIAYDTGFNSIITFNRVFKKITGMVPKEYITLYKVRPSSFPLRKVMD